eukprot:12936456-Prorocentrum_lima.AAC.1
MRLNNRRTGKIYLLSEADGCVGLKRNGKIINTLQGAGHHYPSKGMQSASGERRDGGHTGRGRREVGSKTMYDRKNKSGKDAT